MKHYLREHWIKISLVLVALLAAGLGRLTSGDRAPAGVLDDGVPVIAVRPPAVNMSPESLPDRSGGRPILHAPQGASLDPTDDEVAELMTKLEVQEWFGVYSVGQKVGFGRLVMRPTRAGERGGYFIALDMVIRSSADGVVDVFQTESAWNYSAERPFALLRLETREASEAGVVERRFSFTRRSGELETVTDGGSPTVRQIEATRETLAASLSCDPRRVRAGDKTENVSFDESLLKDVVWQTTVERVEQRRLGGVTVPVAVVHSYAPHDRSSYVTETLEDGVMLGMAMGDGFALKAAPRHEVAEGIGSMDAIADGVLIQRALGDPKLVQRLTLILTGGQSLAPPEGPNQRVEKLSEGRFRLELGAAPGPQLQEGEALEFLKPSSAVDSDHPSIKRAAQDALAGIESEAGKIEALLEYVDTAVEDSYSSNLGTASQVLAHQRGDCTEHTMLFLALARASGVPAREVSGLVYTSDIERRFAWHAWAEVGLAGRWVAVDPTFGEVSANPTHIKLGSERDARWMSYGKLSIEVLE